MKNWDDSAEDSECPAAADYDDVRSVCAKSISPIIPLILNMNIGNACSGIS